MNREMHGKKIQHFDIACDCYGNPQCVTTARDGDLTLEYSYHGDRDEFWIVQSRDGKELARWNASSVDRIVWAD